MVATPVDGLVDHVARVRGAHGLSHLVVVLGPIKMVHTTLLVDGRHPHVVGVLDASVGVRVLLAEAADVEEAVLHGGPLALLALVVVAVTLNEDVTRNGTRALHELKDDAGAVVHGVELAVEAAEGAELHTATSLVVGSGDDLILKPVDGEGAVVLATELAALQDAVPLALLVLGVSALLIKISDDHKLEGLGVRRSVVDVVVDVGHAEEVDSSRSEALEEDETDANNQKSDTDQKGLVPATAVLSGLVVVVLHAIGFEITSGRVGHGLQIIQFL